MTAGQDTCTFCNAPIGAGEICVLRLSNPRQPGAPAGAPPYASYLCPCCRPCLKRGREIRAATLRLIFGGLGWFVGVFLLLGALDSMGADVRALPFGGALVVVAIAFGAVLIPVALVAAARFRRRAIPEFLGTELSAALLARCGAPAWTWNVSLQVLPGPAAGEVVKPIREVLQVGSAEC